jgi:glycerophosphoryl diester phosphodiesterase
MKPFFFEKRVEGPVVVAHRGASSRVLENSPAAIALAASDGADMIEIDVRLSADGEPVVMHDARTGRTARENLRVETASSARLKRVRLKNGEFLPFLSDALAIVAGTVPLNIEIKSDGGAEAVCRVLAASGYRGKVALSSRRRGECLAARLLRPDLPCGLVTGRPSASDIAFCLRHALSSIHPAHRALSLLRIRKVKAAGLLLLPYTVDDPAIFLRLVAAGADGVFSNRARELRAALRNGTHKDR